MLKPWTTINKKVLGNFRIFSLRSEEKISPRTNLAHEFFIIDCVHWVNVIPLTPDNHLVMIEQFRHGSNTVELEIPGGTMDAMDGSPVATAVRELKEETGYEGEDPQVIGQVFSNPAIMSNTTYTVLVRNCRLRHEVQMDSGEDLVTRLVPMAEIPGLVAGGNIRHSLVVVALFHFDLWLRRQAQ
ncbi:MAG: NUDIX hydrolase [Verrucomicrobia subdivision 3 bacterium]|nr:NUDIX hydrolase [Limisphaerales bacterium]